MWELLDVTIHIGIEAGFLLNIDKNKFMIFGGRSNHGDINESVLLDF